MVERRHCLDPVSQHHIRLAVYPPVAAAVAADKVVNGDGFVASSRSLYRYCRSHTGTDDSILAWERRQVDRAA